MQSKIRNKNWYCTRYRWQKFRKKRKQIPWIVKSEKKLTIHAELLHWKKKKKTNKLKFTTFVVVLQSNNESICKQFYLAELHFVCACAIKWWWIFHRIFSLLYCFRFLFPISITHLNLWETWKILCWCYTHKEKTDFLWMFFF